jgi:G3E family GTPase
VRTPLVVVTGVDPLALDQAMVGLSWDLPHAVAARHRIDPEAQTLTRVVSDATGIVEEEQIELEHACPTCALREDVLPTLERLASTGRWASVVACLPTGAEAHQLSTLVSRNPRYARRLRLTAVVAALASHTLLDDLLGEDRLRDRGWHTGPDDERGTGEVACAQVELADVVLLGGTPDDSSLSFVRALARPEAVVAEEVPGEALLARRHQHTDAATWTSPVQLGEHPQPSTGDAWRLDLHSSRPFDPTRLVDEIGRLGGGPFRSRGCFWVPTRPGVVQEWGGAGGHLSIGSYGAWNRGTPFTRLLLTGVGTPPTHLGPQFERLLVPDGALDVRSTWNVLEDGLEPWLGDIREVA